MSRFSRIFAIAAATVFAAACSNGAKVEGVLDGAASSDVVVKLLNINRYEILDTVRTDASGKFVCKVAVEEGQPEFIYLFHNDVKVASLLLEAGDKVAVEADTLGNFTVEGSEESLKLAQVEKDYADAFARLNTLADRMASASDKENEALRKELGQEYVNYYRSCVRYVMNNRSSLTVVPVFFQNFGTELPVFGQTTDAILFRDAADSLEAIYPDSRYVKALRTEADRRFGYLELTSRLESADEIGYPDIELPDVQANKIKLSEVDSPVVMVYFWSAADASQKMFNLDVLKSVYDTYHKKGFEIYQVSMDVDKARWARVVKEQNLPWINVCDSRGSQSPYALMYNLAALPATYIICDGALVDGQVVDEKSLRRLLDDLLK
ncbi:MAG: TlpA family protein disulfide reductase [Bacteroidales bacterium]|nr:TlpA family protein disulfide reductase [Bacteroidales bacterium]